MSTKEQIKFERIKLTIRSRLMYLGSRYKTSVRNEIPSATDEQFEQALAWLVENKLVDVKIGNEGGVILSAVNCE